MEREKLMLAAVIAGACSAIPLFLMLDGADMWMASVVRIAFTIIGVCLAAPYHAWAMEIAPSERCFTVCSVGSAIGSRFIGAPMPAISLWLYHKTGWIGSPALLLIFTSLMGMGALVYLKWSSWNSFALIHSRSVGGESKH